MSHRARGSISKIEKALLEKAIQKHEHDIDETLEATALSHTRQNVVEKKDFSTEIRSQRDVSSFVESSEVLLDIHETELEPIVDKLLDVMLLKSKETMTRSELKSVIFSDDSRTRFCEQLQAVYSRDGCVNNVWDQTWLCGVISVATLQHRHVGIARLKQAANLGSQAEEVRLLILVLCPSEVKLTKTAVETGRTFATLFAEMQLRHKLIDAENVEDFKEHIKQASEDFANRQIASGDGPKRITEEDSNDVEGTSPGKKPCDGDDMKWYHVGRGIKKDLEARIPYYVDDYRDGIVGKNTIQKTVSTTLFLYFSVILPAVALGVLNAKNTHNAISVQQVMVGQTIGAIVFTLLAGQPLVVVMTTAPLALFISVIYTIADQFEIDFLAFYACIGLWNSFFLFVYSFFNMSILMKFSSRSTEEIFSNFITIAFITDATKNIVKMFNKHYWTAECYEGKATPDDLPSPISPANKTLELLSQKAGCAEEVCFVSLILMLGTLWLGVTLFDFTKTPFLNKARREFLSDYALPVSVIVFSIVGSVLFGRVEVPTFPYDNSGDFFRLVDFGSLSVAAVFGACGLGFSLSLLFFMDQNISAAMVNSPDNKLVKGNAYHWDLLVISAINGFLCIFGLPFMHAVLPHSPLHVKCLADTEERVEGGYVRSIVVRVRETRLTNLFSNVLIGLSMLFLGYVLRYIPTPVLDGLFLYLAVTALYGNQMFERITLFFTEQSAYPPNHYIRRVPQRKVHTFTICQLCKLLVLCIFGFTPIAYMKMVFPVIILLFLPIRHLIIPMIIESKYLDVLDGGAH